MLVSADPDRGITFSGYLIILTHYNMINDSQSLRFVAIPSIPFYQVLSPLTYIAIPEKFVDAQYDDEVTSADHTMTSSTPSSPQRPSLVGEDIRARALVAFMSTGASSSSVDKSRRVAFATPHYHGYRHRIPWCNWINHTCRKAKWTFAREQLR